MSQIIMIMIFVSIFLASIVTIALIWAVKKQILSQGSGFLELNDSEEALNNAIILEQRKAKFMQKKALFLDRDGVINEDFGYVYELEKLKFVDGIIDLVKFFSDLGYLIIVITNQSGIARKKYSLKDAKKFNQAIECEFAKNGVKISEFFICPHHPDDKCECRKPKPKMILDAAKKYDINLANSIFVGDNLSDMQAGFNAKVGKLYLKNSLQSGDFFVQITNYDEIIKEFK